VILDADLLTERAQNRLLKTLEEPPGRDALILLSENTRHLLPTILSRCRIVKAGAEAGPGTEDAVIREAAKTAFRLAAAGRPYYEYLPVLRKITEDKPTADAFLDAFEEILMEAVRNRALDGGSKPLTPESVAAYEAMIYAAEEARKDLARNVNVGYAMKDLTLRLL
jgi:DNA polymerase-3 subunit delta'